MAELVHLVRRFFGAVKPGAPAEGDERWALAQLSPGEVDIWNRMNNPDRRHAIDVARAVDAGFAAIDERQPAGQPIEPAVLAAALLHDSGKVVCRFRTPSRVFATVLWAVLDDDRSELWLQGNPSAYRTRLAQYRRHPEIGQQILSSAGAAPLTSQWAAQHHLPEDAWTVPLAVGRLLKDCDDD